MCIRDSIECTRGKRELVSKKPLPQGTKAYLVYVFKSTNGWRNNHAASELVELK